MYVSTYPTLAVVRPRPLAAWYGKGLGTSIVARFDDFYDRKEVRHRRRFWALPLMRNFQDRDCELSIYCVGERKEVHACTPET